MKKFWVSMSLCICILGMTVGCAKEEEATAEVPEIVEDVAQVQEVDMEIQFSNETGENIGILKVRPTEEYDWSENLITAESWKDRYEMPIFINGTIPAIENGWQVKTTTLTGEETLWEDVVLEDDTTVVFIVEDGDPFVFVQKADES